MEVNGFGIVMIADGQAIEKCMIVIKGKMVMIFFNVKRNGVIMVRYRRTTFINIHSHQHVMV